MIKKITDIKNIGLFFTSNNIANNIFVKSNLIYAENGLGKTTLVSVLKSIKLNSNEIIIGRKTIHFEDTKNPSFKLLTDDRTSIEFLNNGWSNSNKIDLEIFDSDYIHKNIFSPIEISRENKVNLFEIIIGEDGKLLSDTINILKTEQTSLNSQIKDIVNKLNSYNKSLLSFEDLISDELIDINELNEFETKTNKEINDIKEYERINKIEVLSLVDNTEYNFKIINSYLTKVIEIDLGEIKEKVLSYISNNLDGKGELWLKNGLSYVTENENCPFCNQSISNNNYINLYKQYFSDEYNRVEKELIEESDILINSLNSLVKKINNNKNIIQKNIMLFDKWNSYIELGDIKEITDSLIDIIETYISILENEFESIKQSIVNKSNNTNLTNEYNFTNIALVEILYIDKIRHYKTLIDTAIISVTNFKANIDISKLPLLNNELNKIQTEKNKHIESFLTLKNGYTSLNNRLNEILIEREAKENELSIYNENIFNDYKVNINRLLANFGRKFKIVEFSQSNRGTQKSISIGVELFGKHFSLESNDIEKPSFSNTLSEGDKNSLAFAFFLSKLKKSDKLENKVIVFDDPFSSLDSNRKTKLISYINQLKDEVNQIFILTHHKEFSFLVYETINDIKTFQIKNETVNGSKLIEYNIQNDMLNDQIKYINELKEYLDFDCCTASEIKSKVRLSLETELRHKLHWHISKRIEKSKKDGVGECVNPITLGSLISCLESCEYNPFRKNKGEVIDKLRKFINEFKIDLDHHSSNPQINWNNNDFEREEIIVYINELFEIYDEYI